ncbi:copper homeostasis protein CutC [Pedobacter frigiditerrae]|uniref:PF03932 family protein CutC n=1 Tax=Pedobacter frigiditerrae TaxID=2530452 RepID=A0A4R0MUI3_9SPHI|nr:copper homeostasis protein CutC [Pedobacter frigiditerrae]TCC90407.1 copper homeostasis protein CutC [Pedobacter frigiditerrae]
MTLSNILEICANSFSSALEAEKGGANRIELCENMAEGGTTPSYAQIKLCKEKLNIQVWPIIRPRGGDFLYSYDEFELMKEDIKICKSLNCDGVVTGILLANGEIDKIRCAELIKLAKPMPISFHRAFDMSNDLEKALEDLIELGFVRVLTSGGSSNAFAGAEIITKLVKQANCRIEIMPGAGINPQNILQIAAQTGTQNFHSSARQAVKSKMEYRNQTSKMGSIEDEYQYQQTSAELVKQMVEKLK